MPIPHRRGGVQIAIAIISSSISCSKQARTASLEPWFSSFHPGLSQDPPEHCRGRGLQGFLLEGVLEPAGADPRG